MKCAVCGIRKPRRHCPGLAADICSVCCGNEREVTIDCPLECPYLREARTHEKPVPLDEKNLANADIEVSTDFLQSQRELMLVAGFALAAAVEKNPGVVDRDLREALEALTGAYRTLSAGLYYEPLPVNPYAKSLYSTVQETLAQARQASETRFRDTEVLKVLVTYQRFAATYDQGRPKGRSFIGMLQSEFKVKREAGEAPPLLIQP